MIPVVEPSPHSKVHWLKGCELDQVSKEGKYHVKLFDGRSWEIIEVDDYLPCKPYGGQPELLFANVPDGKMGLALLEKAFAKLYGNWSHGFCSWIIFHVPFW